MEIYNNHKRLYIAALLLFLALTLYAALIPAYKAQNDNAPLPNSKPLSEQEALGKAVFVKEGCVACHTQQVRNVEMDKFWGERPSVASDYARNKRPDIWRNTANLMGSERTGPDLTNIGKRQPGKEWHLIHLFQPRSVVAQSIMPAYPWLFEIKERAAAADVTVQVPEEYRKNIKGDIVATEDALNLVAYLQSLKQVSLPDGRPVPKFLYPKQSTPDLKGMGTQTEDAGLDGASLYAANCQACHQQNGEGLPGAFPALKGSSIVTDADPKALITVIMKGYNGRVKEGFAEMPPIGVNNNLKPEEITAIINHERTSWGNNASKVTVDEVKAVLAEIGK
ncbi:cytochrome-c oxidase [Pelobium manganitolerans]|uniref:Cytochrome-c oxidase n=1 Tax=Pelobium manganitolerans TaxID=1842495 RepID=A0A419S5M0_9SPHI|nr:cbb3-type cytochrome c oxidase subunit II [Pelobium manganitolerans]RKD16145.1 cytochrome-c oxidase [Pelobium manganitolerans]